MKYIFADFKCEIDPKYDFFKRKALGYEGEFCDADFVFSASEEDLKYEQSVADRDYTEPLLEFSALLRHLGERLPLRDAVVFHSACFDVEGRGVAFAARSGVGKTTHLTRWKDYLGDKLTVVNGDKPVVRFVDNIPFAYGTPWNGKENLGCNTKTVLKHICFIERDKENFVENIKKENALERIFNQVYMPRTNPQATLKTLELIDRLLSSCQLWIIHCNMDENAGEIAYKSIFEQKQLP